MPELIREAAGVATDGEAEPPSAPTQAQGPTDRSDTVRTIDNDRSDTVRTIDGDRSDTVRTIDGDRSDTIRTIDNERSDTIRTIDRDRSDTLRDIDRDRSDTLPMVTLPVELAGEMGAATPDRAVPTMVQQPTSRGDTLPMVTLPEEGLKVPHVGATERKQTRLGMGTPKELKGPEVTYTPEQPEDGAAPLMLVYTQQEDGDQPAAASDAPEPMSPRDREGGVPVPVAPPTPNAPEQWLRAIPGPAPLEPADALVEPARRRRRITEKVAPLSQGGRVSALQIMMLVLAAAVLAGGVLFAVLS